MQRERVLELWGSRGYPPEEMEDRRFIYADADSPYVHRSWTGYCIYQAPVEDTTDSRVIKEVWVNAAPEQYMGEFSEEAAVLWSLIDHMLLERVS
jgi:hypothetical protein